jgi:hypothetical protein
MGIELNWVLFKRLIKLELLLLALVIPSVFVEQSLYGEVGAAFDGIVADLGYHDAPDGIVLPFSVLFIAVYLASLFGMLKRRRWGRTCYTAGLFVLWPLSWLALAPVTWSSNYTEAVSGLASMVSGAVLLLAYSRDHGAHWFNSLEDQS